MLLERERARDLPPIEIANRLGVSRNTVQARMKRLTADELLGPLSASLAPAALGRPLLAFVTLSVAQQEIDAVYAAIRSIPEVVEAPTTTGEADLMLRVVARDTVDLHRVTQKIQLAPGVQRSSTQIATTQVVPLRLSALLGQLVEPSPTDQPT